jgi:branched-chain amino acid transport system permease protein
MLAFVAGAAIAGLAGSLDAHLTFFIGPNEFGFDRSVEILTMTVLGGTRALIGPVLGSSILTLLPELLRPFSDFRLVFNGLILLSIVLLLPGGIWNPTRVRAPTPTAKPPRRVEKMAC